MKVLIATPAYGGMLSVPYVVSLLDTVSRAPDEGIQLGFFCLSNESHINRARNRCCSAFLFGDYDKLLFIDSDIGWTWDHFLSLVRSPHEIVGGSYPKKSYPIEMNFEPLPSVWVEGDEVEVKYIPTGFMMIDRIVLEELKQHVPSYSYKQMSMPDPELHYEFFQSGIVDGDWLSEDWYFCHLARGLGFQIWMNLKALVNHSGFHTFHPPAPAAAAAANGLP